VDIKLTFYGAVQNVTGSKYLLQADGTNILVDCGLYQERQFRGRNWNPFPFLPKDINAVFLTHAHLDHCGLLPKLVKEGFNGPIYCTQATAELAKIILLDSAKLLEEDAEHKRKRHEKEGRKSPYPEVPPYTTDDVQACLPLFTPLEYRQSLNLGSSGKVEATLYNAGHVLGSSIVSVRIGLNGQERSILFTGDMGRPNRPIIGDPAIFDRADYVLVESTYGDRTHDNTADAEQQLADVINSTRKAGGNIVIPSFALERSQEILFFLGRLLLGKKIKPIKIYLDSPMASKITEVFRKHTELYDTEMTDLFKDHHSPFELPGLKCTSTTEQSKAINKLKRPVIIIAGSGMCTGGRIKHHLITNISRPESTILFVGFQATGTLGRQILDGEKQVRIFGSFRPVRANITKISGLSAHADRDELLGWLKKIQVPPKEVFVVHGEPESSQALAGYLRSNTGWQVATPQYLQQIKLN
jgi:metallo-beta-lactamase family protein